MHILEIVLKGCAKYTQNVPNSYYRDRCRTTNNMLGDAYGAAVVEALSKKELEEMDRERAKQMENEDDLESAQTDLKGKKVGSGTSSSIYCIIPFQNKKFGI